MEFKENITTMTYASRPGLGVELPAKSILINEQELYIISPMKFSEKTVVEIKKINPAPVFIAPNNFHHMHLGYVREHFPEAYFYGPSGAAKKARMELRSIECLDFKGALVPRQIKGNSMLEETCFYHPASKSLIVTDVLFNLDHEMGLMSRIFLTMAGTYHKLNFSRLVTSTAKDKEAFYASVFGLLEFPFERIIVGHGRDVSREEFEGFLGRIKSKKS